MAPLPKRRTQKKARKVAMQRRKAAIPRKKAARKEITLTKKALSSSTISNSKPLALLLRRPRQQLWAM
jgi:hypothetical protein